LTITSSISSAGVRGSFQVEHDAVSGLGGTSGRLTRDHGAIPSRHKIGHSGPKYELFPVELTVHSDAIGILDTTMPYG
jgi:hypothetical protein